jgi:hypothetical protein
MVHLLVAMSTAPDPAELAPSRDPAAYGRRPLFTPAFLVWIVLCAACLLAGAAIGRFGFGGAPTATEPQAPPPGGGAIEELITPTGPLPFVPAAPTNTTSAPPGDVTALGERVARLETASSRVTDAATTALAAAALSEAAQGAAPFDQDLAAYERLAPDNPDLRALAPLAARGAPNRAALAASLPELAAQAAVASREPAKDAGFLARLWALFGRVIVVRNVDPNAPGVDGVLTRAERDAAAGNLEDAVRGLETLPPPVRAPLADWLAAAERRIEIDRRIEALRAQALAALAPPPSAPPNAAPSTAATPGPRP